MKRIKKWLGGFGAFCHRIHERCSGPLEKPIVFANRFSLVLHALLSWVIYFIMEAVSRHSAVEAWSFMTESTAVFAYNSFMIFMSFMLVYLVRRRIFMRLLISFFWLVLGIINGTILASRVTPFTGQDLHLITDALDIVGNYMSLVQLILKIGGVALGIIVLVLLWKYAPKYQGRLRYPVNIAGLAAVIGLFAGTTKLCLEQRVLSTYFGNIAFAYEDYGLPYCFFCSLLATGMDKPYDYSEDTIKAIVDRDEEVLAEEDNDSEKPNIIMLQLETFFDPTTVEFLEFSEDPIPNFRRLMEEYSSGAFKVPSVGAGTANTEFECITGMNLRYFGPGEYPYKTILKETTCESVAYNLKDAGYATHAIHNNKATFYSRADVFKNLGFDTYTSKEYMDVSNTTENGWLKDEVLIEHILDCLDSTARQDFIYTISVQGHGEYPTEKVLEDPAIRVTGAETEEKNNQWEYYVNQLHEMDQFIADLIDALDAYGEDYVLVMYGDHLPTLGLTVEDVSNRYLFDTSYVIVDNIGLEKEDQTLCSYQIAAEVLDKVDIHTGTMMQFHQARRKTKWYLPDMELLQYDLLYGERYAYGMDGESPYETVDMQMGIHQPEIRNVVALDEMTYVFGENFTTATKVYVDDEYQSTTFINDHVLQLKKTVLEEDALIAVKQLAPGKARRVLSEGNTYSFRAQSEEEQSTDMQEGTGETA
ncbi:MAG: LTA synthase family protein [Candidatus Merdisoma sp.]